MLEIGSTPDRVKRYSKLMDAVATVGILPVLWVITEGKASMFTPVRLRPSVKVLQAWGLAYT